MASYSGSDDSNAMISCDSCTFENPIDVTRCTVCDNELFNDNIESTPSAPQYYQESNEQLKQRLSQLLEDVTATGSIDNLCQNLNDIYTDVVEKPTAIENNCMQAMEHIPELLTPISMLYFNCVLNGNPITVFVDTGAEKSVISKEFAEKCGLGDMIDTRCKGVAVGVGQQAIIGRIWMVDLEVDGRVIPAGFSVLDNVSVDIIFGLDLIRSLRAVIDCDKNLMRIGDVIIPFVETPKN